MADQNEARYQRMRKAPSEQLEQIANPPPATTLPQRAARAVSDFFTGGAGERQAAQSELAGRAAAEATRQRMQQQQQQQQPQENPAGLTFKKGGSVKMKGWGMARGAKKAKYR